MKEDDVKSLDAVEAFLNNKEKMDRRGFISTTGKAIIPALGVLGLSLKLNGNAAADCYGGCKGSCEFVCGGCDGTCKGKCEGFMFK